VFSKIKKNYFLFLSTFLVLYFFLNLMDGERGLISYFEKKDILSNFKIEEKSIKNRITDLEIKNSLLKENLDLDYVELLIRKKFLYGKRNEKTYLLKYE
tara:strand:+ start:209 stop:505 length:297 start_codon:yes stop_codon:yes gene_type:complete